MNRRRRVAVRHLLWFSLIYGAAMFSLASKVNFGVMPGSVTSSNTLPGTKSNTIVISSAGQLGRGGNVTVDAADNNDDVVGGPLQNISQEAVQEFQVMATGYSPEFGRSAGAVVNAITKSGTNNFHGSAFHFHELGAQALHLLLDCGPHVVGPDRSSEPPRRRRGISASACLARRLAGVGLGLAHAGHAQERTQHGVAVGHFDQDRRRQPGIENLCAGAEA